MPIITIYQGASGEGQELAEALERCHGNRAAAARQLGLHEKYLLRLLKSLGIGG